RRAHGHTADVDGPISYDLMADDTISFMDALGTGPGRLVGGSAGGGGGAAGCDEAPRSGAQARPHGRELQRRRAHARGGGLVRPGFADVGRPGHARNVEGCRARPRTGACHARLDTLTPCWSDCATPPADLARIAAPTLVMVGDDDIVRYEHTIELFETI